MANATDFIAKVYDTLANTFNMGAASPNLFMQMAWPGIPISTDDCKDVSGQFNVNLAEELFSSLANIAPTLNKSKFENSGFNIDDIYEIIVSSARPNGIPDAELGTNPLYKLFADAQFEYVRSTKGSFKDPNENYHKSNATPSNWYDEAASSFWTTINITSNEIKSTDSNSLFIKRNGLKLIESGVIKTKAILPQVTPINVGLMQTNMNSKVLIDQKFKTASFNTNSNLITANTKILLTKMDTPIAKPIAAHTAVKPTVVTNKAVMLNNPAILNNSFKVELIALNIKNVVKRPLPVNTFVKNNKLILNLNEQDINRDRLIVKPNKFTLTQAFFLNDLLIKDLPTKASVNSDGFNISFKFCRVNIERPWLNLALLASKNWNIYGASVGEYSNGLAENNPGIFPLLPTSFILISKVSITANWSTEDKANLTNAVSFGPFDLRNGSFNQNTLEIKGMQIIGCLSKLTPQLAPTTSPLV
jgi:hypothetical protein